MVTLRRTVFCQGHVTVVKVMIPSVRVRGVQYSPGVRYCLLRNSRCPVVSSERLDPWCSNSSICLSVCPDSNVISTVIAILPTVLNVMVCTGAVARCRCCIKHFGPGANDATEALYKTVVAFSKEKKKPFVSASSCAVMLSARCELTWQPYVPAMWQR